MNIYQYLPIEGILATLGKNDMNLESRNNYDSTIAEILRSAV